MGNDLNANPSLRLVSTDFDGTLYSEFLIPHVPRLLQDMIANLQVQGVSWVINTGRDLSSLMEALARCRLTVRPDYLVLVEREIYYHTGSKYVELEHWNSQCRRAHDELFKAVAPHLAQMTAWVQASSQATLYEDPYSPFCLVAGSNEEADSICAKLQEWCRPIPHLTLVRNDVYARLSHDSYNKGTALREIATRIAAPLETVFAVGDHYNDLPMLLKEFAGCLAAPENAIPEVKESVRLQAGYVSTYSQGYGVADALQFYLRKETAEESASGPG